MRWNYLSVMSIFHQRLQRSLDGSKSFDLLIELLQYMKWMFKSNSLFNMKLSIMNWDYTQSYLKNFLQIVITASKNHWFCQNHVHVRLPDNLLWLINIHQESEQTALLKAVKKYVQITKQSTFVIAGQIIATQRGSTFVQRKLENYLSKWNVLLQ